MANNSDVHTGPGDFMYLCKRFYVMNEGFLLDLNLKSSAHIFIIKGGFLLGQLLVTQM